MNAFGVEFSAPPSPPISSNSFNAPFRRGRLGRLEAPDLGLSFAQFVVARENNPVFKFNDLRLVLGEFGHGPGHSSEVHEEKSTCFFLLAFLQRCCRLRLQVATRAPFASGHRGDFQKDDTPMTRKKLVPGGVIVPIDLRTQEVRSWLVPSRDAIGCTRRGS